MTMIDRITAWEADNCPTARPLGDMDQFTDLTRIHVSDPDEAPMTPAMAAFYAFVSLSTVYVLHQVFMAIGLYYSGALS